MNEEKEMKAVTSIYSKLGMASYYQALRDNASEWSDFYSGVACVWFAPPLLCSIGFSDLRPLVLFAIIATIGGLIGLMMFENPPEQNPPCVPLGSAANESPVSNTELPKAA